MIEENDVRVKENSELTYYIDVIYDGKDSSVVSSSDIATSSVYSDYIEVTDKIPEGLTFLGFVNSEDGVIKLPAADTISNVYLVFDGDNRTDTVEYYDEDDNNKLLFSDSVQGKVGQIKSYSTADAIKKNVKNYTVDKDELTTENANQGINGIKFDASGNHTYKV